MHDSVRYREIMTRLIAMSKDEVETDNGRALCAEAFRYAPPEIREKVSAFMEEIGIIPKAPSAIDDQGNGYYSLEQIAKSTGTTVEEVRRQTAAMVSDRPELSIPAGVKLHLLN